MEAEDAGAAAKEEFDRASRWAAICEWSEDAIIGWSTDGIVANWNSGAERMYGYAADEIVGRHVTILSLPDRVGEFAPVLNRLVRGEHVPIFDTKAQRKDGSILDISISLSPIRSPGGAVTGISSVARDITERKRAEKTERLTRQRPLQEAEPLETLARLADGIAHDFNNMLAAITNYAGFIADESHDRPGVRADAEQIQAAAQRAAALTRQLLILTQRDVTQPGALDLNAMIARAAIPESGTMTIGTSLSELGDDDARLHPGVSPGRYAELTVSDTGIGTADAAPGDRPHQATILVVDDEPALLEVTGRILRKNGYTTLQARTYEQALSLASSREFQLLLTDSMMPGMTGATLAELITGMKPGMPVLHMSGYNPGVPDPEGIRGGEVAFIQKPFTAPALLEKVRTVLKADAAQPEAEM